MLPVQIDALPEKPYDDEYRMVKDKTLLDEDVLWLFDDGYATMMMTWLGYTNGSLGQGQWLLSCSVHTHTHFISQSYILANGFTLSVRRGFKIISPVLEATTCHLIH